MDGKYRGLQKGKYILQKSYLCHHHEGTGRYGCYVYEDDYAKSTTVVREMIARAHLRTPWTRENKSWFASAVTKLVGILFAGASEGSKKLYEELKRNGFSEAEALEVVQTVLQVICTFFRVACHITYPTVMLYLELHSHSDLIFTPGSRVCV